MPRPSPRRLVAAATSIVVVTAIAVAASVSPASSTSFPGRNGTLAFTIDDDLSLEQQVTNGEVGVLAPDGTRGVLTDTQEGYWSWRPNWSADGTRIAYLNDVDGDLDPRDPRWHLPDVWVMAADGSGPVNLTNTPDVEEELPTWSPDGSRISFTRYAADGTGRVWTMAADGSDQVQVTAFDSVNQAWSPDGTRLLIVVQTVVDGDEVAADLATIAPDGSDRRDLTDDGASYRGSWAPDGSRVVFSRGLDSPDIWTMAADGTDAEVLVSSETREDFAAWSPDGTVVAFSRLVDDQFFELATVSAAGGEATTLLRMDDMNLTAPNWQPLAPLPPTPPAPVPTPEEPAAVLRPTFTG